MLRERSSLEEEVSEEWDSGERTCRLIPMGCGCVGADSSGREMSTKQQEQKRKENEEHSSFWFPVTPPGTTVPRDLLLLRS